MEMEEQALNLFNKSILPANDTAVTLGDKMLMMDSLASPLAHPEAQSVPGRFPMKLSMPHLLIVETGEVGLNVNFHDSVVKAGCCALIGANAMLERVAVSDDARIILISFSRSMTLIRQQSLPVVAWRMRVEHMTMLKQVYHMMRTIMLDNAFAPNREESVVSCLNLMGSIIGQARIVTPMPNRHGKTRLSRVSCTVCTRITVSTVKWAFMPHSWGSRSSTCPMSSTRRRGATRQNGSKIMSFWRRRRCCAAAIILSSK